PVGTVSGNTITNIPLGTQVEITASNGPGCEVSQNALFENCPDDCVLPDLTVTNGLCDGTGFYSVLISETTGADITLNPVFTIVGNTITGIPVGTDVTVTATNPTDGACEVEFTVESPADCDDPCANAPIAYTGPICATDSTYTVEVNLQTGANLVIVS